ncbi:MAG: hypothetical protein M0033_06920 [Nitrospiraceae bacterium]|nr:hypothetical protein [Nitrospiraceae bacterium]
MSRLTPEIIQKLYELINSEKDPWEKIAALSAEDHFGGTIMHKIEVLESYTGETPETTELKEFINTFKVEDREEIELYREFKVSEEEFKKKFIPTFFRLTG